MDIGRNRREVARELALQHLQAPDTA